MWRLVVQAAAASRGQTLPSLPNSIVGNTQTSTSSVAASVEGQQGSIRPYQSARTPVSGTSYGSGSTAEQAALSLSTQGPAVSQPRSAFLFHDRTLTTPDLVPLSQSSSGRRQPFAPNPPSAIPPIITSPRDSYRELDTRSANQARRESADRTLARGHVTTPRRGRGRGRGGTYRSPRVSTALLTRADAVQGCYVSGTDDLKITVKVYPGFVSTMFLTVNMFYAYFHPRSKLQMRSA